MNAYETLNPDFGDMNIEEQIECGCCDWCVEDASGHQYFGHSAHSAIMNATAAQS